MAIPTERSVLLPLLKVIADAGGELQSAQAVVNVEQYFPGLSEADKLQMLPSGNVYKWENRVHWARMTLVEKGYIDRQSPKGIWRTTERGREFFESGWPTWKPNYSGTGEADAPPRVEKGKNPKAVGPGPVAPKLHEQLKDCLHRIGDILEHFPQKEYRESPYVYDVIWREFADAPRSSHVFEVQDRGNLIEALAKLQHARDIWGSKLFLIVTGEKDRQKLSRLVAPLLSGTFHRLARNLVILSQEDVQELHESLGKQEELLKHLLT